MLIYFDSAEIKDTTTKVRKDVWGVEKCGKVYGVSGEVCWRVGKGCGQGNGEDVGKCVEVWGPNTLLIPRISLPSLFPTSPLTCPTVAFTNTHTRCIGYWQEH